MFVIILLQKYLSILQSPRNGTQIKNSDQSGAPRSEQSWKRAVQLGESKRSSSTVHFSALVNSLWDRTCRLTVHISLDDHIISTVHSPDDLWCVTNSEFRRFKKFMTSNQPLLVFNVLLKKKKDQQRLLKLVWMKELEDRIWNFVEIQHSYSKSQ